MFKKLLTTLSLTLALGLSGAFAQTQRGIIDGKVVDNTAAVLPGVSVTVAGPLLITAQTQTTDTTGSYVFVNLLPGTYTLTYAIPSFQTLVPSGGRRFRRENDDHRRDP